MRIPSKSPLIELSEPEYSQIKPKEQFRGNFGRARLDQFMREAEDSGPNDSGHRLKRKCSFDIVRDRSDGDGNAGKGWARPPAEGSWDKVSCLPAGRMSTPEVAPSIDGSFGENASPFDGVAFVNFH